MNGFIKLYSVLSSFETTITERRNNAKGITAIEYALMAAGIAGVITAAMLVLGDVISAKFNAL